MSSTGILTTNKEILCNEQRARRANPANRKAEKMSVDEKAKDGFEGYEDRVEGDDQPHGGGIIKGTAIRFSNEATWTDRDEEELPDGLELVVVDVARVVQKWIDRLPVETRILEPGEKFPDIEQLNQDAPRSEWANGPDGKARGPWQMQHIVYLLNPETMDRFTFPTGTVGGQRAVREVVDKTKWMRKLGGAHVYPVITLSDAFMPTAFGGRQRPHFEITRWVSFAPDETALPAPLGPDTAVERAVQIVPGQPRTIGPPTLAEEMNDEIPSFGERDDNSASDQHERRRVTKRGVSKIARK
jgi:hypothetical protein